MKIILKIALYTAIILFLSISSDEEAGSRTELPKTSAVITKSQAKVETIPYYISSKIRIKNPIYKEKIALNSSLEINH